MSINFYPHDEDIQSGSLDQKLEMLKEAAERFKAAVLDASTMPTSEEGSKRMTPREIKVSFNWQEIAHLLRLIHEMPESNQSSKVTKARSLTQMAEVYEILRSARMAKLEAVRAALISEASRLTGNAV